MRSRARAGPSRSRHRAARVRTSGSTTSRSPRRRRSCPARRSLCSRAATFVVSPDRDRLWASRRRPGPTAAGPVLIPTRTLKSEICHELLDLRGRTPAPRRRSRAQSVPRARRRPRGPEAPKKAAIPSPMYACTMPPNCSTAWLIRPTNSPITSLTSSGLRRSPSVVEPTMSANSAVTGRSSSCREPAAAAPASAGSRAAPRGRRGRGTVRSRSSRARSARPRPRTRQPPTCTRSPLASTRRPSTRSPLTQVPLSDPRSSISSPPRADGCSRDGARRAGRRS